MKVKMKFNFSKLKNLKREHITYIVLGLYLVVLLTFFILVKKLPTPDLLFFLFFIVSLLIFKVRNFLKDWIPFLLLIFGYDAMKGIADNTNISVHITDLINLERAIFGFIPTIKLQDLLYDVGTPHWYDYLTVTFYSLHFLVPFIFAFIFWMINREWFRRFAITLLVLSFSGFMTYLLFPAMPPWLASEQGYLPEVHRVVYEDRYPFLLQDLKLPTIYSKFNPNLVGAMPSLHIAYPWLVFLFIFQKYRWKSLIMAFYTLALLFTAVYGGEHYVIDGVVGMIYASVIFVLMNKLFIKLDVRHKNSQKAKF